jgi:hypothetical protein
MSPEPTPPVTAKTLGVLFEFTYNVTKQNADGFTHEESIRPPQEAGNCLNWVVGHMIASRHDVLAMLGQTAVWSEDELKRYGRGSAPNPDGAGAMFWEKMFADFDATQERLRAGLAALTPEVLAGAVPEAQNFLGLETIGEVLAAYNFHESYHAGQVGILRRVLGREGVIG